MNLVELRLNAVNNFKIFYVAMIMLRGQLLAFHTKYNHNIMVEIDLCIFRLLYWKISVHYHIQK